jgi:hypothetical protein
MRGDLVLRDAAGAASTAAAAVATAQSGGGTVGRVNRTGSAAAIAASNSPSLSAAVTPTDDDDEKQARLARSVLSVGGVAAVEAIFQEGCTKFRHSPMMHVFAARFHAVFAQSKHIQMSLLLRAARQQPGLEVSFLIYRARQAVEAASGGSGGRMNALARVIFDKHFSDASSHVLRAMRAQVAFWTELSLPVPDVTLMHHLSAELTGSIGAAEAAFHELMQINATSLVVLQLYAQFCLYLTHDGKKVDAVLSFLPSS